MTHLNRRGFLAGSAALLGLLGAAPRALAKAAPADRKFLFVFAQGGWDPSRVFADALANPNVSTEAAAARATAGGLSYIAHPTRPSVDAFFAAHHAQTVLLNGLLVPSVQHEVCTQLMLTGRAVNGLPDWGSAIAGLGGGDYTLPHLVAGGPSFPGPFTAEVARTGTQGQLDGLLSGDVLARQAQQIGRLSPPAEALIDRYLARRATGRMQASAGTPDEPAALAFEEAIRKADQLEELRYDTNFTGGGTLLAQMGVAIDSLSRGIARCVSINDVGGGLGWDSHDNNDDRQALLFEALFEGLGRLMDELKRTPGTTEATLADETIVVVLSEMGRTPLLNNALGKDHWPYTSAMLIGPGLTGGRVVGGFDEGWFGAPMNPEAAALADDGVRIGPGTLGATLLAAAGLDPEESMPGVPVLRDILS